MADNADSISKSPELWPRKNPHSLVPDHDLVRLIGSGSYGEVWLAKNAFGTYRAVKVVYEKRFRHKRPFDREFNGVQKFEPISRLHEGLVDILQVGQNTDAGCFYYVMELADDVSTGQEIRPDTYCPRTLAHDIAPPKSLSPSECRQIGASIAAALDFVHSRGLIHRDVKPSNIIFVDGTPKLADIGLVAEVSEARSYVGTEGFIPPEGPGTIQADIYSLGKVLYESSTGKDRHDYPELPTKLGEAVRDQKLIELNKVILKACRFNPQERYKSAKAMALDLLADESESQTLWERTIRRLQTLGPRLVGPIVIACIVGAVLFATHNQRRADAATGRSTTCAVSLCPVPAPDGLVGWWKGEGDASDALGTLNGTLAGNASFGKGEVGRCFVFDGWCDGVLVGNPPELQLQDFTIEAWIKRFSCSQASKDPRNSGVIFCYAWGGYALSLHDNGTPFLSKVGYDGVSSSLACTETNSFHHLAVTKNGASIVFYIDGRGEPIGPYDPGFVFNGPAAVGGRGTDFAATFFGSIDEVAIYNRSLSSNEIHEIYKAGSAGKYLQMAQGTNDLPKASVKSSE